MVHVNGHHRTSSQVTQKRRFKEQHRAQLLKEPNTSEIQFDFYFLQESF